MIEICSLVHEVDTGTATASDIIAYVPNDRISIFRIGYPHMHQMLVLMETGGLEYLCQASDSQAYLFEDRVGVAKPIQLVGICRSPTYSSSVNEEPHPYGISDTAPCSAHIS